MCGIRRLPVSLRHERVPPGRLAGPGVETRGTRATAGVPGDGDPEVRDPRSGAGGRPPPHRGARSKAWHEGDDHRLPAAAKRAWARLIRQAYEVDPRIPRYFP